LETNSESRNRAFIQNIRYDREVKVFVVSENGASVYSASKTAREVFPILMSLCVVLCLLAAV
jgi:transcriptional accessory protein Tex/SPT6